MAGMMNSFKLYAHLGDIFEIEIVGAPTNGYVTEDSANFYVAEDGVTFYVQEI